MRDCCSDGWHTCGPCVGSMCGKTPPHVNVNRCVGVAALSGQCNHARRQGGRPSGAQTEKHPRRWKRHGTEGMISF